MSKKNRRRFAGLTVLYVIGAALETVSISAFLPLASTFLDPSAGRKKLLLIALAVFLLYYLAYYPGCFSGGKTPISTSWRS